MERAGEIRELILQPKFQLGTDDRPVLIRSAGYPNGRRAVYIADFAYIDKRDGQTVVEDVKGMDTRVSRLKRAVVEAQYSIRIAII